MSSGSASISSPSQTTPRIPTSSAAALTTEQITKAGTFLNYQRRWLSDPNPRKIGEKGRQQGWTWTEAYWTTSRRLKLAAEGKRLNHYFSSADSDTAKEFIDHCRTWAEAINLTIGEQIIKEGDVTITRLRTKGGDIIAVSSKPKALRGKKGDVTLDEFAFHEDAEAEYDAAEAVTTWGTLKEPGHFHIFSTHNGPGTLFYKLCRRAEAKENTFSFHRATLVDALRDGLALKVPGDHQKHLDGTPDGRQKCDLEYYETKLANSRSREAFGQEYMCVPLSTGSLILPEEYEACTQRRPIPDHLDRESYGDLYLGMDVGVSNNPSVIWVLEKGVIVDEQRPHFMRDVYRTVAIKAMYNTPIVGSPHSQWSVLNEFLHHPNLVKAYIDQGTIGHILCDLACKEHGGNMKTRKYSRIVPFAINRPRKEELCEAVKGMVQQRRIGVPDEGKARDDILAMRRELSGNGNVTYEGSTTYSHCDWFMALSLALRATDTSVFHMLADEAA